MISTKIFLVGLVIFCVSAQQDSKQLPPEGDVIILNNQSFQSLVIQSEDAWMIDFYAPWCGHCIKMSKDWDKFATKMKGSVNVAKIDASEHSKFNDVYGLKGFPHIVFLPAGKKDQSSYFTHNGARTAQAFEKWVMQKIDEHKRSSLEKLTDEKKWTEICLGPHSDFCTIFFLPSIANSSEEEHDFYLKTIKGLITKFSRQPISWLWTKDGDHKGLQQLFGLQTAFPYIVLVNPSGRRFAVMQKAFTEDDFTEWLKNAWDIEFKQFQGKLPFGDQMPETQTAEWTQTSQQL